MFFLLWYVWVIRTKYCRKLFKLNIQKTRHIALFCVLKQTATALHFPIYLKWSKTPKRIMARLVGHEMWINSVTAFLWSAYFDWAHNECFHRCCWFTIYTLSWNFTWSLHFMCFANLIALRRRDRKESLLGAFAQNFYICCLKNISHESSCWGLAGTPICFTFSQKIIQPTPIATNHCIRYNRLLQWLQISWKKSFSRKHKNDTRLFSVG